MSNIQPTPIDDVPEEIEQEPECDQSPSGFHESQVADFNSIPACQYCGRIM